MSASPAPDRLYPGLTRPRRGRIAAGAALGLAEHLGVAVRWVRVFFALASFAGGLGLVLYALLWVFTPVETRGGDGAPSRGDDDWPRAVSLLLAGVGFAGGVASLALARGVSGNVVLILGIVAVGAVVAWQAYDRGVSAKRNLPALALGIVLVMGGVLAIALLGDTAGTAGVVVAVLATVFGVSLLVIPLVVRLATSLMEERKAKAVADQRAEIASRLHDSVLQTLALIQKRSTDPSEVARLARAQERELRAWLFDADPASPEETLTFFGALVNAGSGAFTYHQIADRLSYVVGLIVGDDKQ